MSLAYRRPLTFKVSGQIDDGQGNIIDDGSGNEIGFVDPPLVLTFKIVSENSITDENNNPIMSVISRVLVTKLSVSGYITDSNGNELTDGNGNYITQTTWL